MVEWDEITGLHERAIRRCNHGPLGGNWDAIIAIRVRIEMAQRKIVVQLSLPPFLLVTRRSLGGLLLTRITPSIFNAAAAGPLLRVRCHQSLIPVLEKCR